MVDGKRDVERGNVQDRDGGWKAGMMWGGEVIGTRGKGRKGKERRE